MRAAIIGCGDIAGGYDERSSGNFFFSHAGCYKEAGIKITAAFDPDSEKLNHFCDYWKVEEEKKDLKELLQGKYDIVSVCSPDNTHAEIIEKILDSQCTKYIWTEKPFTLSAESGGKLLQRAKEMNVGIVLSNQRRFEPVHKKLSEDLRQGLIGEIIHCNGYYVKGVSHIGVTMIDTVRLLCGEIDWVEAVSPYDFGSYGDDKSLRFVLGLNNGTTAMITGCDNKTYTYSIFELDIIGTLGRVKIEENGDVVKKYKAKKYDYYDGFMELKPIEEIKTGMPTAMKSLLDSILSDLKNDNKNYTTVEEGIKDLLIVDRIKKSALENGKRLTVTPHNDRSEIV